MNNARQQIAIAIALGWTKINGGIDGYPIWARKDGAHFTFLPRFTTDLNAIHEAELTLTHEQCDTFTEYLWNFRGNDRSYFIWRSTAAQRAEAFLRTLGKWEVES